MTAALGGHPEVVWLLIKAEASIMAKDMKDRMAFEYAKITEDVKVLESLPVS